MVSLITCNYNSTKMSTAYMHVILIIIFIFNPIQDLEFSAETILIHYGCLIVIAPVLMLKMMKFIESTVVTIKDDNSKQK